MLGYLLRQLSDFKDFPHGLTQAKLSKETRPYLSNVVVVEFRRGSTNMFLRKSMTKKSSRNVYSYKESCYDFKIISVLD